MQLHWWSIEVRDGAFSGAVWRDAHGDTLIEAAVAHGAREWGWVRQPWGIVFEIAFSEPEDWMRFRDLPAVRAALDAVPDRINGLYIYIYPGRGGGAGAGKPRRPRLPRGAAAAPIPEQPRPVLVAGRPEPDFQPPTLSVA